MRIFIVDDEALVRRVLARFAAELRPGADLAWADQGEGALEHCVAHRPDIVFLDLDLPGKTGFDLCPLIKAALPATVVVAVSGAAVPGRRDRILAAGADRFLSKPFTLDQIDEALRLVGEKDLPTAP